MIANTHFRHHGTQFLSLWDSGNKTSIFARLAYNLWSRTHLVMSEILTRIHERITRGARRPLTFKSVKHEKLSEFQHNI